MYIAATLNSVKSLSSLKQSLILGINGAFHCWRINFLAIEKAQRNQLLWKEGNSKIEVLSLRMGIIGWWMTLTCNTNSVLWYECIVSTHF